MTNSTPSTQQPSSPKPSFFRRRWVRWTAGILVAMWLIGLLLPDEEPTAQAKDTPAKVEKVEKKVEKAPAPKKTEAPKKTAKEKLTEAIHDVRDDAKVKIGGGDVEIKFPFSDNLTTGLMRTGAQIDTTEFLKAVKDSDYKNGDVVVVIEGTTKLVDEYGSESTETVLNVMYSGDVLQKIHFGNIDYGKIWELSDMDQFVHPAIQE